MELSSLNLLILINCCLCYSYPYVLCESLSHVINQESHVYTWNVGKIYLISLERFKNVKKVNSVNLSQISPHKHVITGTNLTIVPLGYITVELDQLSGTAI